ncbi:hypothetical protein AGABI1DRAFT_118880 [Agaricus bisporus var. burnettii JB137-S8]|uniref:Ataxin-10 homolog n=1 Tax=Agaricus bisporus var. burnettii (strain JB137-S8 / ATCC MYA-4627 / FGSC 10392) TaxID=597362 RepID=K5Y1V5_AGABU|nr:uncharacterized protein AGABI1DRAFT_118880 [Agaricus bisporus var. burnettii JB137-S8]EKM81810.1 hypothetical protein AGABI1DRAFT_118880 [Agaricus bisporus var. burnettii JB137-S8]
MSEQTTVVGSRFTNACADFDIRNADSILALGRSIDTFSPDLAGSHQLRISLGSDSTIWPLIRKFWKDLARAHSTFWDDTDDGDSDCKSPRQLALASLCASLAKFTRNLVAGVPDNQSRAAANEPDIRRLLHYYTSWSAMEDEASIAVARILTQALSNLVTGHEELMDQLWGTYLRLPEDQVVIIRLLGSPDTKTILSTLIFISNCISQSRSRTKLLCKSEVGVRICVCLLDSMLRLFEADEGTEAGKAFDIGYHVLERIIEEGFAAVLYRQFFIPDEIITPHQTTLLKIIDSYLQSNQSSPQTSIKPETLHIHSSLTPMLTRAFFSLSRFAQDSIRHSLGLVITTVDDNHSGKSEPSHVASEGSLSPVFSSTRTPGSQEAQDQSLQSLDVMLPKVCEALVLVTQCMVTIAIEAEEYVDQTGVLEEDSPKANVRNYFMEARPSGFGVIESLIELLRLLDKFLPRINFGKSVSPTGLSLEEGAMSNSPPDNRGFAYLKRDLVRLLGILCHEKRAVQDRIREAGGIEVVMNMCVIDERNPYLKEHAILTLRNLLKNNSENQEVVKSIQPQKEWEDVAIDELQD